MKKLKPLPKGKKSKGLRKLPKPVRNKMGFMKKGGKVKIMAKLCPKGKAAAKRKFKVYPSAYANMYASKVCKGKVRASAKDGGFIARGCGKVMSDRRKKTKIA